MKPTLCRMVIYREKGGPAVEPFDVAAMIVATPETLPTLEAGTVNLTVFGPTGGTHTELGVRQQPEPAEGEAAERGTQEPSPGCWRWPERV